MEWIFLAFIGSLFAGCSQMLNQHWQLNGRGLVLFSRAFMALFLVPGLFFITWPTAPLFYLLSALNGVIVCYSDTRIYNLVSKYGGGSISRSLPLSVVWVFVIWVVISPMTLSGYIARPLISLGLLSSIILCVICTIKMRQGPLDREVLLEMAPVLIAFGSVDIINKMAMDMAPNYHGIYLYIFIQSTALLLSFYAFSRYDKNFLTVFNWRDQRYIKAGLVLFLTSVAYIIFKNTAFVFADNPGYVSTVLLLSPVWITLYNKIIRYPDQTNIRYGLGIVLGVILLTIFSSL